MTSISKYKFEIQFFAAALTVAVLICPIDFAQAACATPTANIGALDFQGGVFKYCDGTTWQNLGGGGATTDASLLTSGTLADARLSSNVPLLNAANTFSVGGQQVTNTAAGTIPLTIRAAAAQSATLTEWEDSVGATIYGLAPGGVPIATTDLTDKAYVDTAVGNYVLKAGDTMTGPLVNNTTSASTALAITQAGAGYAATFMGGNVGIGTATPGFKLQIDGTDEEPIIYVRNKSSTAARYPGILLRNYNGGTAGYPTVDFGSFGGTSGTTTATAANATVGGNLFKAYTTQTEQIAFIGAVTGANFAAGDLEGALVFKTRDAAEGSPGERMRINPAGNVGIGIANPTSTLHISGSTSKIQLDRYGSASTFAWRRAEGSEAAKTLLPTNTEIGRFSAEGYDGSAFYAGANVRFYSEEAYSGTAGGTNMRFYTTAPTTQTLSEAMRISGAGNVGIGTTAPARLLHVNGPMRVQPAALPTGVAGDIAIDSGASNALKYYNGSAWVGVGGGGATNIDGLSDAKTTANSVFLGTNSGNALTTGTENTAAGFYASEYVTSGSRNTTLGYNAGVGISAQNDNTALGHNALYGISSVVNHNNTAVGSYALFNNGAGVGAENTMVGASAMSQSSGSYNAGVGNQVLDGGSGSNNAALGWTAGSGMTGSNNVAVGNSAAWNAGGADNVFIGYQTFFNNGANSTGARNVIIGSSAVSNNISRSASDNVILGNATTQGLTSGSNNVVIGQGAGSTLTTGGTNILIGLNANVPAAASANFLNIGSAIFGTGLTGTLAAPAGNIGIGTTNPARLLHVNGPMRVQPAALPGTGVAGDIAIDSGASNALKYYNGSAWVSLTGGGGTGDFLKDGTVAMTGTLKAAVGTAALPGYTFSGFTGTGMFTRDTNYLGLSTAGSERMVINPSGNVGIGTTNPIEKLTINTDAMSVAADLSVYNGRGIFRYAGNSAGINSAGGLQIAAQGTYNSPNGSSAIRFFTSADSGSAFVDGAYTERMSILNGGNVGIGTTAPGRTLHIAGSQRIERSGTPHLEFIQTGAAVDMKNWRMAAQTDGNFYIIPYTDAGTNNGAGFQIDHSGNVGIGTTAPTSKLEVAGNINASGGQLYSSQNTVASGATVDFNTGNVQVLQSVGGAAITLNNMKDGGSYTVIVNDTTSRTYTFTNCTNTKFIPANAATESGKETIYTILKVTLSSQTYCYISWITGF